MMSSSIQAPTRKNKGRQKVKMEKIENESNLQVTFSKRRGGLFKKANELCIMCGAEVLIIVFSPAGKAYSYGHPDVESVANKFLNEGTHDPDLTDARYQMILKATRDSKTLFRNMELTQLTNMLAMERRRAKELKAVRKQGQTEGWINPPLEKFNLEQLDFFEQTITNYEQHFNEHVAKVMSYNPNLTTNLNDTNGLYATGDMEVANNVGSGVFVPSNNSSFPHVLDNVATGFDIGSSTTGGINDTGEVTFQSEGINNWAASFGDTEVYPIDETNVANTTFSGLNGCNSWDPSFGDTRYYATGVTNVANNFVAPNPYGSTGLVQNDLFATSYDPNGVADPYCLIPGNSSDAMFYAGSRPGVYSGFDADNGSSLF